METEEDCISLYGVCDADAFLKGEIFVRVTDHFYVKAFCLEEALESFGEAHVELCFGADSVGCTGILAAMACIEDDSSEIGSVFDEVGAEDGVD